jgi:hypothetical protein
VLSVNQTVDSLAVSTTTQVTVEVTTNVQGTIITTATSTSTNVSGTGLQNNTTLTFTTTNALIQANSYIAIHPSIVSGQTLVSSISTNTVTLVQTLTNYISTGSLITFIPVSVNTTTQVASQNFIGLGKDYQWQVDSAVIEPDGYVDPKKVLISFYDYNDDGQIDDPDSFENIVHPVSTSTQTGFRDKFVYFQYSSDRTSYSLYTGEVQSAPTEDDVISPIDGQLYYFYDPDIDVIKRYSAATGQFVYTSEYFARIGRANLKFHYVHNSGEERRLDPSKTNIIDIYLLTKTYDTDYRNWLASGTGFAPLPPTTQSLEENYAASLEPIKSLSDVIVYHPAKYKVLFGSQAVPQLQAVFKAVRNPARVISVTDIQTRILKAIEDFFNINNWTFGQTFNFSELSTYVMNIMTPDIINFVIVPKMEYSFGSLYQITCLSDEIFVNGATVNDIQVIDSITSTELKTYPIVISSY